MKAIWNGTVIAESDDTVVVEGNHYFPPESVRKEFLLPSNTRTIRNRLTFSPNENREVEITAERPRGQPLSWRAARESGPGTDRRPTAADICTGAGAPCTTRRRPGS